jgi:LmbE family N-acetylglucosaminyl deacetylase
MLILSRSISEIYFPENTKSEIDLSKTTHLGIGAHQDDLEIFAIHGILQAYQNPTKHFTGVTITNGRGAPRTEMTKDLSNPDYIALRNHEQKQAANIGKYLAQFLLNYESDEIRNGRCQDLLMDLIKILEMTSPDIIYTHNLADQHDTHVSVALFVIEALRNANLKDKNIRLFGCEVWRNLDWMSENKVINFNVSQNFELHKDLLAVYKSQNSGGKRYDCASLGRRLANATFTDPHTNGGPSHIVRAMDLTPLIKNPRMSIQRFMTQHMRSFVKDVRNRLDRLRIDSTNH